MEFCDLLFRLVALDEAFRSSTGDPCRDGSISILQAFLGF